jgi:hypothetical protein
MTIAEITYFLVGSSDVEFILLHFLLGKDTRVREVVKDCTYAAIVSQESGVILHLRAEV